MPRHIIGVRAFVSRLDPDQTGVTARYRLHLGMARVSYELVIPAPIDRVWSFHASARDALPLLAPPGSGVVLEHIDEPQRVGARVVISARGPFGKRLRWVAVYEKFLPVHTTPDGGQRAEFVDVQESGPFKSWRHAHVMTSLGEGSTKLVDTVDYIVPLGVLGVVADKILVRRELDKMFRHRHAATLKAILCAPA